VRQRHDPDDRQRAEAPQHGEAPTPRFPRRRRRSCGDAAPVATGARVITRAQ
jgi:hypothetical protein